MAAEPTDADETFDEARTLADEIAETDVDDGVPTPEYDNFDAAALMEAEEGDEYVLTLEETLDGGHTSTFDVTATVELVETPHTCDRTCHVYVDADALDEVKLVWTATGDVAGRRLQHTDLRVVHAEFIEAVDETAEALDDATGHDVSVEKTDTPGADEYRLTADSGRLIWNELSAIRGLGMEITRVEGDQHDHDGNEAVVHVMEVDDEDDEPVIAE